MLLLYRLLTKHVLMKYVKIGFWLKSFLWRMNILYLCCDPMSKHLIASQWRHNGRDSVSNHQPHDCLLNCLFRRRWKKTSKLRVTGLCVGNSPVTGEFPTQMASNAENVSIWWRRHGIIQGPCFFPWLYASGCHLYSSQRRNLCSRKPWAMDVRSGETTP